MAFYLICIHGKEDKAIDTLNKIPKSQCDPNMILASIYIERNEFKKSRELLQSKLYQSINNISLVCMGLANSYFKEGKDLNIIERYYNLIIDIKNTLSHKGDLTLPLSMDYLNFA
ncbi:Putative DNA-binding protein [Hathewaya histolytica]|uniref:Putative DNA-binding protein n=1 Tax=Hathewaya histolytica TaxID=1498 RepID=A0A4U9RH78_HATHI|nr:putative DNA-binding protein [Hathewaya histolytica]